MHILSHLEESSDKGDGAVADEVDDNDDDDDADDDDADDDDDFGYDYVTLMIDIDQPK